MPSVKCAWPSNNQEVNVHVGRQFERGQLVGIAERGQSKNDNANNAMKLLSIEE